MPAHGLQVAHWTRHPPRYQPWTRFATAVEQSGPFHDTLDNGTAMESGPSLAHFQGQTRAPLAFQVVLDADYVDADCFARSGGPLVVPARTFLSQLL